MNSNPWEAYFDTELKKLYDGPDFSQHLNVLRIIFRFKNGQERAQKMAQMIQKTTNKDYLTQMLAYSLASACFQTSQVLLDHGVDPNQPCPVNHTVMLNNTKSQRCEKLLIEHGAIITRDVLDHKTVDLIERLKRNSYFESTFNALESKEKKKIDGYQYLLTEFLHQNHHSDQAKEIVYQNLHLFAQKISPSQYELDMFSALGCPLSYHPSDDYIPVWSYAIMNTEQPERLALLMDSIRSELKAYDMPYAIDAIRENLALKRAEGILSSEAAYCIQQIITPYLLEKSLLNEVRTLNQSEEQKPKLLGTPRF